MNILVTNDDGIESPGLWVLAEALSHVGNVQIMAPEKQQSGSGSCVTMIRGGVNVTEVPSRASGVQACSVSGTPCDCVFLAMRMLTRAKIDLLVSGINIGPNLGYDIPYSGTVMATLTGYFLRIPSMAVSLAVRDFKGEMRFETAGRVMESLARCIAKGEMITDAVLNVNVPNVPPELIKGMKVTRAVNLWYRPGNAGTAITSETKTARSEETGLEEGTDIWAVHEGYVSVTPLRFDVTHHDLLPEVSRCLQSMDCNFTGERGRTRSLTGM